MVSFTPNLRNFRSHALPVNLSLILKPLFQKSPFEPENKKFTRLSTLISIPTVSVSRDIHLVKHWEREQRQKDERKNQSPGEILDIPQHVVIRVPLLPPDRLVVQEKLHFLGFSLTLEFYPSLCVALPFLFLPLLGLLLLCKSKTFVNNWVIQVLI